MKANTLELFAVSPPGLELFVAAELEQLGHTGTVVEGGVEWSGTGAQLRHANLWLRVASRVLVRAGEFRARTFFELERHAANLPWSTFVSPMQPVALRVTARKSKLYHQRAIAERLLRALAAATGARPSASADEEGEGEDAQLFVIRVLRDDFTISADSSGALLHRRGYRQEVAKAPVRETIAAALLYAAQWRGDQPLLDPFCGSGTIPIEAALMARDIAPGLASESRQARAYAFEQWPGHDTAAWQEEVAQAGARIREAADTPIFASDRDAGAVRAARANAARAGVEADITWTVAPLSRAPAPPGPGALVTNPPYGVRVSGGGDLRDLYAALGNTIRERLADWRVALLAADRQMEKQTALALEEVAATTNGGIRVRLLVTAARDR